MIVWVPNTRSRGSWGRAAKTEGHGKGWACPGCGDHQFARNVIGRLCGEAKPDDMWPDDDELDNIETKVIEGGQGKVDNKPCRTAVSASKDKKVWRPVFRESKAYDTDAGYSATQEKGIEIRGALAVSVQPPRASPTWFSLGQLG